MRRLKLETLEARRLLSLTDAAITSTQQDQLSGGLDGLSQWADTLDDHDLASQSLPTTGLSVGESIDLGDLLAQGLADPIADYFALDVTPTTDELVTAIEALDNFTFDNVTLSVANVSGGYDSAENEVVFTLEFQADRALSVNPSLGPEGEALGIAFGSTISADAVLTFNFTFGIDLTGGLDDDEAFFIRPASLAAEVDANVPSVPTGPMKLGFFDAALTSGNLALDANLVISLANPDLDAAGNITLAELEGTELSSFVSFVESGSASGSVTANPGTLGSFSPSGTPTISFNSANPFVAPSLSFNAAYDEVQSFSNISSFGFVGVLEQLSNWLDSLGDTEVLDADALLAADGRIGDLIALDEIVTEGVIAPLVDMDGIPTFATAQQLETALASALGLSLATIDADYNPSTKELTYHLIVDHTYLPTNVPVGFGLDLSPISGFTSASEATLNADGDLEMTLGVSLDDLSAVMTATAAAPANGQISTDSAFALNLGLGSAVAVALTAASTSDNTNRSHLVADLNAALATAGLSASVVAALDASDRLTFSTITSTLGVAALELKAGDYNPSGPASSDPIVTELGFRERHFAFDSLANHAFLEDATIDGALSLSASDIDGDAKVGFLGVAVDSGSGTSTADFSLELKDVATQTPGGRVGLFELFEAVALDITNVVDVPTLSGAVSVSLPVDADILGESLTTSPELTINWADRSTGAAVVTMVDGAELEPFENLSSADFGAALGGVGDYLGSLEDHSYYGMDIPGISKSLGELGEFSGRFAEFVIAFQNDPAAALDNVELKLEQAIGLDDEDLDISLVDNGNVIRADLMIHEEFVKQIPIALEFPFTDVFGTEIIEILVDLRGSALLNVDFELDFQLSFGIDISNALNLIPFVYESSYLTAKAEINAQNISFDANILFWGIHVRNGELLVDDDGLDITRDQAIVDIQLSDNNAGTSEGKISLATIDLDNVDVSITGQVNVVLPIYYPNPSTYIGNLELRIGDLADIAGTTTLMVPDLEEEEEPKEEENNGLLDNVSAVLAGLDAWFQIAIDAFNGKVGSVDLPFVGKDLGKVADFLEEVHEEMISQITARFHETEGDTGAALQTALWLATGPTGLNILKDRDGSGTVTIDDVEFVNMDLEQDGKVDQVEFYLDLGQDLTVLNTPIDFDIGLPGLGLDVEGDLEILLGYEWNLSFGVSNRYGFYLLTEEEDEISIDLEIRTPDLEARGELAFLQIDVADEDADSNPNNDGIDVDMDGRDPSSFTAGLTVDFLDPFDDPEDPIDTGKMTETEIEKVFLGDIDIDDALAVDLVGVAEMNLDLLVSFEGDSRFPSIGSEFTVVWDFAGSNSGQDLEGGVPTVAFTNITLNAGEFIADFADTVLKQVQQFTQPIQPIVEFVTSPIPLISEFGFDFTPLDIARALGYATEADYVEAVAGIINVINSVPEVSDDLMIPLGDFIIVDSSMGEVDLRDDDALVGANPMVTDVQDPVMNLKMADDDAGDFFDDLKELGIILPLIENPTSVFQLLIGQSVDLFLYDIPPLEVSFPFPIIKIGPLIPPIPLFASISGSIGARIDLAVGFDSHGIQEAAETGDWWDVFNGFYLSDTENPDGTGEDVPEATLFGSINAGAEISLIVVGAGVSGGVDLELTADLVDTNNDGKVHLDELIANIPLGVTGTFDLGGSITAHLDAYVELLFKRVEFTFAEIEIASFEFTDEDIFTDRFTGNNSMGTSRFLGAGPGLHIDGLSIESTGDVDWFEFELLREESIEVDIRHSGVHGAIELEVYDAGGQLLAEGKSGTDREFAELLDVPAGNYFVRVNGSGELNNYQLAIEPDQTSDTRVIYVNPTGAFDRGDAYYTTAPGDAKYDGLTHRKPKPSLQSVLDTYDLGPNDIVVLETGTHAAGGTITTDDQGAMYIGSIKGSTLSGVSLENANDNLFHRVSFASNSPGLTLFGSDNNVFDLAEFSGPGVNLVIDDSDNNLFDRSTFSGSGDGIQILGNSVDDAVGNLITRSDFQNQGTSIDVASYEVNIIDGNTFTESGTLGIHLAAHTPAIVVGNDIGGRATGMLWESRVAQVWDNDIHGGGVGIETIGGVVGPDNPAPFGAPGGLAPNRVFGNDTGVLVPDNSAGAIVRHTDIYSNTLGVEVGGDQTQLVANDIHNNTTGVSSSRIIGPDSWDINLSNLIHHNTVGVQALPGAEVRFNRVYANETGIEVLGTSDIHHNLIYRNTGSGLLVSGTTDVDIVNNTIYVPSGSGIQLEGAIDEVVIRNNIVSTAAGFGLFVEAESQFGYDSDYNNFFTSGGGVAFQGKGFSDLYDWQVEAESDLHSLGTTVLHPTLDDPLFVDLASDDYHLKSGSTSIDAGDPTTAYNLEPSPNGNRVNLGAYGNTPQATQSPTHRLEITEPNFYVDLVPSRTYTLAWESNNIAGGVDLDIDLYEVGVGKVADIATVAASAGSTTWTPGNFVSGDNSKRYRIHMETASGTLLVEESREPFAIVDHDPALANTFYVNDSSTVGDVYTSAVGDNRNTGLTADAPKVVIRPLVLSYAMDAGDVVRVDSGDYIHAVNLNLSGAALPDDPRMNTVSSTSILGPIGGLGTATIDRANPFAPATALEMIAAPSMTLADLTIVGADIGVRARGGSTQLDADRLVLTGHTRDGLSIEGGSDDAELDNLTAFSNGRNGIFVDSLLTHLRGSEVYDNAHIGIALRSVGAGVVDTNEAYQNFRGIDIINPGAAQTVVGHPLLPAALGNKVHHNDEDGVFASGNVWVVGNTVNENANIGIRLDDGADAELNVVHQHTIGISALGSSSDIIENRSYVNTVTGIEASLESNVLRNVTYNNQLHGIHVDRFSGVIDHNLVYSTGYASMNIEGPGQAAQVTYNTVYEPCAVAAPYDPAATAVVDTDWDMNIFMQQFGPPFQMFPAPLWGNVVIEFQDAVGDLGDTFDLGPGGGTGAQLLAALPEGQEWTIDYEILAMDLSSAMFEPIPGVGIVEASLSVGPISAGQLVLQNVGGTLVGSNHLELYSDFYFTDTDTTLLADGPVVIDYLVEPTMEFGELDALKIPTFIPSGSSFPGFLFNLNAPSDGWQWDIQDADVTGDPDPPPQDPGDTCAGIGVLIQNNAEYIHLRHNAIYVQGDPNAGPGDPVSMDIVVDSTSTHRFDSDFNALIIDHGVVGSFGGLGAATLTDWQNVTGGEDLHSLSPNVGDVWVDPDGDDNSLAGLLSGDDDNFHLRSPYGQVEKGALAPVKDIAGGTDLPVFTPVVWQINPMPNINALSPLVDAGGPSADFSLEPIDNGMFANIGVYGNTLQASNSEPEYVQLVYPIGAEQLVPGQTYDIQWRSYDTSPPNDFVEIELVHVGIGGLVEWTIDLNAPNTGSYLWTVPLGVSIGNDYVIVITMDSQASPGTDIEGASPFLFEVDGDSRPPEVLWASPDFVELENSTNSNVTSLTVEFSENVFGAGSAASYELRGAGPNGVIDDVDGSDDVTYTLNVTYNFAASDGVPTFATLDIVGGPLPEDDYRLTVYSSSIGDNAGNVLDGNMDGLFADYVRLFTVDQTAPMVSLPAIMPDPRNDGVNPLTIVFDEPVTGVGLADVRLTLDGGPNLLSGTQAFTTSDGITWQLADTSVLTEQEGVYTLELTAADANIRDLAGNALVTNATTSWTVDNTAPRVDIVDVTPDPRNTAVSQIDVVFSEPVTNFTLADIELFVDGVQIGLSGSSAPSTSDNIIWTIGSLAGFTATEGSYLLKIVGDAGLVDAAGNQLEAEEREVWQVLTGSPAVDIVDVTPDPRTISVDEIVVSFDVPVTGFDVGDLVLTRNGINVSLAGLPAATSLDLMNWHVTGLSGVSSANGQYVLTLDATGSGIADFAGNALTGVVTDTWLKDDVAPTVAIGMVAPDPTNQALASATITFSKPITGLGLDNLVLTRDAQLVDWQAAQAVTTTDGVSWTLQNLSTLTSLAGDYQLTLDPGGGDIQVFPGNELLVGDSEAWLYDPDVPTVWMTEVVPNRSFSANDTVEIVFSEPVFNFDVGDLVLRRRGMVVPLTAAQTLSTSDNITWTLSNLSPLTVVPGKYELSLPAVGSGVEDAAANPLLVGTFTTWRRNLPGDTSGDNRIGLLELGRIQRNLGTTSGATQDDGDLTADAAIDRADLVALLPIYNTTLPPKPVATSFNGAGATTFANLASDYATFLGAVENVIGFDGLSGAISPTEFTVSHGVTFSNLTALVGADVEGDSGIIEHLDGYDGTYEPDGDIVYANYPNHMQPLTFEFDTPVASVGSFLATGVEGSNHSLTVTAFDGDGAIIQQITVGTQLFANADNREAFWAIATDIPAISKVSILNNNPTDFGNALMIDNLAWSSMPAAAAVVQVSALSSLEVPSLEGKAAFDTAWSQLTSEPKTLLPTARDATLDQAERIRTIAQWHFNAQRLLLGTGRTGRGDFAHARELVHHGRGDSHADVDAAFADLESGTVTSCSLAALSRRGGRGV